MAAAQLQLLPLVPPLAERFGAEFFRAVPERPGVYLLCGAEAGVLYVGKAKNLRRRLGSYRAARPERLPPKLRRLLSAVRRIHWDECASEAAALARERELLLALKPRFNTVGVHPSLPIHLGWQPTHDRLVLSCGQIVPEGGSCHGPVSGGRFLAAAVLRLLWWTLHPTLGWQDMPRVLRRGPVPVTWEFVLPPVEAAEVARRLDEFFQGRSPELVEWYVGGNARRPRFERAWIERDALRLWEHFEKATSDGDLC
ncbi:MAG TPA: GIY-YIG nuclease family protein [Methylomirabilota bacterium]|nr:GIY-YIG nuclease family protein [Methylomirabilota bacterium]